MTETVTRQRLAVLAADLAGYSRLTEVDEEGTHARLMRLEAAIVRPNIAASGGRLVKHTGDGFLAAFERVSDAVDCALAIQENAARVAAADVGPPLLYRMGLNLTDAILETHDIFGEGVNLAARLQASAEPGGLVVSDQVAMLLRGRGGIELTDLGELSLKNLRRSVHAYAVEARQGPLAPSLSLARMPDDRPSIVVMPFRVGPEDVESGWFAEGVVENIIHTLAGVHGLFVIARGTALAYGGRDFDKRLVGQELGVRYLLSGSVQRSGDRVRILTELVDGSDGSLLRTSRHNGRVQDLFEMQDQIAEETVAIIAPSVRARELERAKRKQPNSMTAYELFIQALDLLYRLDGESFRRARELLMAAIAVEPSYAPAHAYSAVWHTMRIAQGWSTDPVEDVQAAHRFADAAIQQQPCDSVALAIYGHVISFAGHDVTTGLHFLERAIDCGPNCPTAWVLSSATHGFMGNGDRAVDAARRALRLSPLDPMVFFVEHMLSQGHYVGGEWGDAIQWGRRAAARNGLMASNLRILVASLVADGRIDDARATAHRLLAVEPQFRLGTFAQRSALRGALLGEYVARLRSAGLPE